MQKSFVYLFVFFFLTSNVNLYAQEEDQRPKLEKAELDLMDKIAEGHALRQEKLKLADLLMRKKYYEQAYTLYEENLGQLKKIDEVPLHINFATTMLNLNDLEGGISHYFEVTKYLNNIETDESAQWLEVIRQNTLFAFNQQGKSDKSKNDKNNKDKNSESEKDNQSGQNQDNEQKNQNGKAGDENQQQKNQNKPRDPKDLDKDQKDKDKKEKESKNQDQKNKDQEKDKQNESENQKNENQQGPQKKLKVKLPAQLKQLMNDDRSLQEKLLDTSTSEKFKTKENKDW
jgi:Ca-activated chloride channel family protein